MECMRRHGIRVGYVGDNDLLPVSVAEHAVMLALMTLGRTNRHIEVIRQEKWKDLKGRVFYPFQGEMMQGKTVGIVGLGRIGYAVAQRLKPFKPKAILYASRKAKLEAEQALRVEHVCFPILLERSDIVIITCLLSDATRHLFDMKAFEQMKHTAVLINVARGAIVKQDDLIRALDVSNKPVRRLIMAIFRREKLPSQAST